MKEVTPAHRNTGTDTDVQVQTDRQTDRQTDEEERNNPLDFKTHWRRRLSVQLQRCNASVLARKMIRVTYGQKAGQSLDLVQLSIQ